jgi:hypothetical protein
MEILPSKIEQNKRKGIERSADRPVRGIFLLEDIAQRYHLVLLDGSAIKSKPKIATTNRGELYNKGDICKRVGHAYNFREFPTRLVLREIKLFNRWIETISANHNILTVEEVVDEFEKVVLHYRTVLSYLKKRSKTPSRAKEAAMNGLTNVSYTLYSMLQARSGYLNRCRDRAINPIFYEMMRTIRNDRLNEPRIPSLTKQMAEIKEVSEADLYLTATALYFSLQEDSPIAIITDDLDIANIIRNYGEDRRNYHRRNPYGIVDVYSPSYPEESYPGEMSDLEAEIISSTKTFPFYHLSGIGLGRPPKHCSP